MTTTPAVRQDLAAVLINGDVSSLSPDQRVQYVGALCESLGLNALLRPFQFIEFEKGNVQLYATRSCAEQLREAKNLSIVEVKKYQEGDYLFCDVTIKDTSGRTDTDTACIWLMKPVKEWNGKFNAPVKKDGKLVLEPLTGEALANAHMKVVTKAKRRATLAFAGLGIPDESELDTVKEAKVSKESIADALATPEPTPEVTAAPVTHFYNLAKLPADKQDIAYQMAMEAGATMDPEGLIHSPVEIKKLRNAKVSPIGAEQQELGT